MLEINPNIPLFRHHPHLKTYIHSPIEQAINESFQTVQRSLRVATSAAETIVRKDFLFNPDEQQLRTSARNMVAYLSSGLVLITARSPLQEQIQSYIKTHFHTVLGISPTSTINSNEQTTSDMIQQAAAEIATANIELCCCLLQRITISRAIQLIDQRLANDIDIRQRCRTEGRKLPIGNTNHDERLPESIRLLYGPLSSHQLAIYEDFVHYIPGFKPNDNEKHDTATMNEAVPSVWDRLIAEIDQTIQTQHNQTFVSALQRLLESLNVLRSNLQNQTSTTSPQVALTNVLNIILCNFLEHYTMQSQLQDNENFERFKTIHMNVLKLLIEIRLHISIINKQLTKSWLECPNELKFNIHAVNHLIRNRLLDIRQIDAHVSQLIDSGNNGALPFAVNFLRNCVIEQPCCVDTDIASILDSLHRISLIGKQPAEAVRDLLEIIRLNYTSLTTLNENNESKVDKLAIISLSVISNGVKYLSSIDDIETATIVNKAKHILSDWVTLTITQTNRMSQQQAFQEVFNQVSAPLESRRTRMSLLFHSIADEHPGDLSFGRCHRQIPSHHHSTVCQQCLRCRSTRPADQFIVQPAATAPAIHPLPSRHRFTLSISLPVDHTHVGQHQLQSSHPSDQSNSRHPRCPLLLGSRRARRSIPSIGLPENSPESLSRIHSKCHYHGNHADISHGKFIGQRSSDVLHLLGVHQLPTFTASSTSARLRLRLAGNRRSSNIALSISPLRWSVLSSNAEHVRTAARRRTASRCSVHSFGREHALVPSLLQRHLENLHAPPARLSGISLRALLRIL